MKLTKEEALKKIKELEDYINGIDSVVPESWESLGEVCWYYTNIYSSIVEATEQETTNTNKNIRPTKELAKASLAMSQLAQLRNKTWENDWGWKPDWGDGSIKYTIIFWNYKIKKDWIQGYRRFLVFRTEEIRDEFLEKHRELIEQAKPLL